MNRSRYRFLGLVLEGPHERTDLKTFSISANSRKSFRAGLDEVVNVSDLDIGQILTNMSWKFWQLNEWDPILYLWALWYLLEIETESEIWLSIFFVKINFSRMTIWKRWLVTHIFGHSPPRHPANLVSQRARLYIWKAFFWNILIADFQVLFDHHACKEQYLISWIMISRCCIVASWFDNVRKLYQCPIYLQISMHWIVWLIKHKPFVITGFVNL